MSFRQYLPESMKDVSVDTAMTAGAVGLGTLATLANLFAGDKTEAAAFFLLTAFGAYRSGELNPERLQQRREQITSALFKPAPATTPRRPVPPRPTTENATAESATTPARKTL